MESFWDLTPRELKMVFEAGNARMIREHNQFAWLAHAVATLTRSKRIPKLDQLKARDPSRRRQTWQEQQAIVQQWVAVTQRLKQERKALGMDRDG